VERAVIQRDHAANPMRLLWRAGTREPEGQATPLVLRGLSNAGVSSSQAPGEAPPPRWLTTARPEVQFIDRPAPRLAPPCSRIDHHSAAGAVARSRWSQRPAGHRAIVSAEIARSWRRFVLVCCIRTVCTCPLTDGNANLRRVSVCQQKYFAERYPDYENFVLSTCLSFGNELAERSL